MRLNVYVAQRTGLSRRASDALIASGEVQINGTTAQLGAKVIEGDRVTIKSGDSQRELVVNLDNQAHTTIIMNKPTGYVCSRNGQGNKTVYDLLPDGLHHLKTVGRLDKDSSGLLVMTDDGQLNQSLTHPKHQKIKIYEVILDKSLEPLHQQMISDFGIQLDDGISQLQIGKIGDSAQHLRIIMSEGRNRQIRRTFASLGYEVSKLHRTHFGDYRLGQLKSGKFHSVDVAE